MIKYADPVTCGLIDEARDFLITGSWDRTVTALDLKKNEIDKQWVGTRDCVKCLHLFDKWLFVAGLDQVIRAFCLESGKTKVFEGHTSWILTMKTYVKYKEDGSVQSQWLLSGSDDNTVRIWDIATTNCLEELQGHKNGIQAITFANNDLFTGSFDNYIICWSLPDIEEKIRETQAMMAEDLRSKKFEAFEAYMESKGKRKKGKAKGKAKGKGKGKK